MTRKKMIAANNMNPPSTQRAVLSVGSSLAVCRAVLVGKGWVGVSIIYLHDYEKGERKHHQTRDSSQFR